MSSDKVAVSLPTALPQHTGDMEALQEELERLNKEIIEANDDRAKAAEYGIVLLEEKQALQSQNEELTGLFDTTKRELETSVEVRGMVYTYICIYMCVYRKAGNIGGEVYLADWRFSCHTANIKSTNIAPTA